METTKIICTKSSEVIVEFSSEGIVFLAPGFSMDNLQPLYDFMADPDNWYPKTSERGE